MVPSLAASETDRAAEAPHSGAILRPWLAAAAIMCLAAWGAFPLLSVCLKVSPLLLYWSLVSVGMSGQLVLLLRLVRREGVRDWKGFRQRLGLACPREARSERARPGLFWWLVLWIPVGYARPIPHGPVPHRKDHPVAKPAGVLSLGPHR
jgi:hypothetical protein